MQTFCTFLGLSLQFIQLGEEYKCIMNQLSWETVHSLSLLSLKISLGYFKLSKILKNGESK
jgi:hypothetical protein